MAREISYENDAEPENRSTDVSRRRCGLGLGRGTTESSTPGGGGGGGDRVML